MDIIVKQPSRRIATFLPLAGTRAMPNIIIPWGAPGSMDPKELAELENVCLNRKGLSPDQIKQVLDEAERRYEDRIHVGEAKREIRRRLEGQVAHIKRKRLHWESF